MSRIPDSRPSGCREARLYDSVTLLLLSISGTALITWRFRPWRWMVLVLAGLILLEITVFALIGAGDLALLLVLFMLILLVASVLVLAAHNIWRVLDPGRIVLLATDNGACLDAIFHRNGRITLSNHCRAFGASSAPSLRQAAATWLRDVDGGRLDLRAQNTRVAAHYMAQFPQLRIVGRDWMGHVRLGMRAGVEESGPVG